MNDDDKNNPDLEETEESFDDFEDAFEDDFESEETSTKENVKPSVKETATNSPPSPPVKKSGSPLPIIIGIAVFCFFGWKLLQNFGGASKKPPAEEQPAIAIATPIVEPIAQPVLQPEIQEKPVVLPPAEPSPEQKELTQVQLQITAQEKQYQEKIQLLEKEFALTKQNTENTARVVEKLSYDLSTLTASMHELSEQIDNLRDMQEREMLRKEQTKSTPKPKRSAAHQPAAEQSASLTVYAIIPGRAWLRSPNGKTLTVTEGDTLAEYGKILKIDASNGVVITTSGVTLR